MQSYADESKLKLCWWQWGAVKEDRKRKLENVVWLGHSFSLKDEKESSGC